MSIKLFRFIVVGILVLSAALVVSAPKGSEPHIVSYLALNTTFLLAVLVVFWRSRQLLKKSADPTYEQRVAAEDL